VAERVESLQQQWQQKAANWQFEPDENGSDELLQDEREYRDMVREDRTYVPPHMRLSLIQELHELLEFRHAAIKEICDTTLASEGAGCPRQLFSMLSEQTKETQALRPVTTLTATNKTIE
jgi:hypothetical protein